MRAAIYARYSSDLQRQTSIDDQVAVCRRYAAEHGWVVSAAHIYTDAGISGASLEGRPGIQALLAAAATGPSAEREARSPAREIDRPAERVRTLFSTTVCPGCGQPFRPTRRDQRHCRPSCRKLAARKAISQRLDELFERLAPVDPGRAE